MAKEAVEAGPKVDDLNSNLRPFLKMNFQEVFSTSFGAKNPFPPTTPKPFL